MDVLIIWYLECFNILRMSTGDILNFLDDNGIGLGYIIISSNHSCVTYASGNLLWIEQQHVTIISLIYWSKL